MARRRGTGGRIEEDAVYWLLSDGTGSSEVFVADLEELGLSLPVFSFREEAELFLALDGMGSGWRAVESGPGDIISLFFGPLAEVRSVVLDPLPAMLRDRTASLVSLSLENFMDRFLGLRDHDGVAG